jgi:hypothetical protein
VGRGNIQKCNLQKEASRNYNDENIGKGRKEDASKITIQLTNIDLHFILILHPENKILSDK